MAAIYSNGVTAGIFLASILLKEMRYLVYIRYLCFISTGKNSNNIVETQEYLENCLLTTHKLINTPLERELFQRRLNLNREKSTEVGRVEIFTVKFRS